MLTSFDRLSYRASTFRQAQCSACSATELRWVVPELVEGLQFTIQETKDGWMMETLYTEDDYREALKRFLEICDTPEDTEEAGELEKLMYLLEQYEEENCS